MSGKSTGGSGGRKIGRNLRSPSHTRYVMGNVKEKNKKRKALKEKKKKERADRKRLEREIKLKKLYDRIILEKEEDEKTDSFEM